VREGLTEDDLTIFDLLCKKKENLSIQVRNRIKQIAQHLLESIQAELQKLENWRDKETTKAQVETIIYNYLYEEATGLPAEFYNDEEVADLANVIFLHIYQQSTEASDLLYADAA
jgi:type I restriction enzyme, R subunit